MQKCYIQTIELDPTLEVQQATVYPGWGQLNGCVNYDATQNKINIYIGYVWDDSNPSPLQQDSLGNISIYLYAVDQEQEFDNVSLIGTVQLPDGTVKVVMNDYTPQPISQPDQPQQPAEPTSLA